MASWRNNYLDDVKDLLCDEEYDPIIRMQLEDLLMGMEVEEQEDLLFRAYMNGDNVVASRMTLYDVFYDTEVETSATSKPPSEAEEAPTISSLFNL